jgi:hypothetical protein
MAVILVLISSIFLYTRSCTFRITLYIAIVFMILLNAPMLTKCPVSHNTLGQGVDQTHVLCRTDRHRCLQILGDHVFSLFYSSN